MAIFAMSISTYAANVSVTLINDQTIEGKLISYSDTSLVLEPIFYKTKQQIELKPDIVRYFKISGIGIFSVMDGKFVPSKKTQAKLEQKQINQESLHAANPNEIIAKAFKSTGGISMGIGIPSLLVGGILIGVGNSGVDTKGSAAEIAARTKSKAACAAAGYVLMPMGAALTIVGIPLYVHGQRIAELHLNYTGNGAGIAMFF